MAEIVATSTSYYRIPLPEVLTDSMHGNMREFELVTVQVKDTDGSEGTGYTFTVSQRRSHREYPRRRHCEPPEGQGRRTYRSDLV